MRKYILLFCLLNNFLIVAQTISFSHFTLEHNLPADFLMQDSKGYIWIGSDGVFRFDGLTTKRFVHDSKNTNSLINNTIRNIVEDKDGTIWMATQRGISHYYPTKDSFENYTNINVDAKQFNALADNFIFCDDEANIWLGNQTGIYLFNRKTKTFKNYPLQKFQQPNRQMGNFITSIIQDKTDKNFLWLSSFDGIVHLNKATGIAQYFYASENKILYPKIFQDSHNNIWVCSWGNGIASFIPASKQFIFHNFQPDTHYGITNVVTDIKEQPVNKDSSVFYISCSRGLGVFSINYKKIKSFSFDSFYINNPSDKKTIGAEPHEILIDKQGTVWIGTSKDISYILHNNQVFKNYTGNVGNVYCIDEEKDSSKGSHYLIAAWYMNGLFSYNDAMNKISHLNILRLESNTNDSKQINTILNDSINNITWIATFNGLFAWNRKSNMVKAFRQDTTNKFSLPSSKAITLAKDNYNRLWIGMYGKGIAVMNLADNKCILLPTALKNIIESSFTPVLFADKNNHVWIGAGERLLCVNAADLSFKIYNAAGDINCITQDKQNNIWIGCEQGLHMFNEQKKSLDLYTMEDGLPNNKISCLGCDVFGNLWMGTAEGISNLNIKTKTFTNYFTDDGLISNSDYNCINNNSKGEVMIGGNNFIIIFNPAALKQNTTPPSVYITSMRILKKNGKDTLINYPAGTLRLFYNQNYFNVYFTALNLINANANKYAYQLDGLDKEWIFTNNKSANYSNLSPGTYIFKIKAANNNGVWNNTGASLTIIISPPFWQTWWFILLCSIAACTIVYSIYRYRLNQILKVERLRSRISTDLHDDIGSTLSSISILSDMVMHDAANGNSKEMLHEIKENSVNLMEKMDDIVWSINPRNDSLEKLLLRIQRFAAQLFEAKNIEYDINISDNIQSFKLPMEMRQHLYLIIKEAINNIIKHSQCTQANINIQYVNDHLLVKIADNGKGFNTVEKMYGNGLINLQERARNINAKLSVQSKQQINGTVILIELKIK